MNKCATKRPSSAAARKVAGHPTSHIHSPGWYFANEMLTDARIQNGSQVYYTVLLLGAK